jgi:hypothetical protein
MEAFLAAYEEFGSETYPPDFYILASYTQALLGFEAFARAYAAGDVTRPASTTPCVDRQLRRVRPVPDRRST